MEPRFLDDPAEMTPDAPLHELAAFLAASFLDKRLDVAATETLSWAP